MKSKMMLGGLLAAALSSLTALACPVQVRLACPNDKPAVGVEVCIEGVGCALTDDLGIATIEVPWLGETYNISVTEATLPAGFTLKQPTQSIKVLNDAPPVVEFTLGGTACSTPPPPGPCWLTGGGTIGKTKGVANYSFGGVVYPGCSPKAADGGNWNVIDHATGLHFQGKQIVVDECSGIATRSPRVNVNIIDFHGTGTLVGIGGNPQAKIDVSFVGRAVDNLESGGGSDLLYLNVTDGSGTVMQIGTSAVDPAVISTGNLQIHTTGCNK
jgi:hypothetical protein